MSSANPRRTLPIDGFVLAIVVTAIIGSMLPATGSAVPVVKHGVTVLIFILFFLYGARVPRPPRRPGFYVPSDSLERR